MNLLTLLAGLISLLIAGCVFGENTPRPTLQPVSTNTPAFTPMPTLTFTSTPVVISMQVTAELINCRSGPGVIFDTVSQIAQKRNLRATGRNESGAWFYVNDPGNPGKFCWVSAEVVQVSGETDLLPIVQPPLAMVTNIDLRVEPKRIVVNCNQFPQTVFFEALVTTNGPTRFTWKWEVSSGVVSDVGTLIFQEAGTQAINEHYQINSPNDYWVRFYALTPNEMVRQVNFPVTCTP
ncbi:MAG: hypothetical protein ACK40V_03920 [Anaerolineales bacterium]